MKSTFLAFLILCSSTCLLAQLNDNLALTVGFRKGYSTFVGVELEYLISPKVGIEVGGGYKGFGTAINFHFDQDIHSSAFKIFYAKTKTKPLLNPHQIGMAVNLRFARFVSLHAGAAYAIGENFGVDSSSRVIYPIGIGYYRVLNFSKE